MTSSDTSAAIVVNHDAQAQTPIRRALISVSDKAGLKDLAAALGAAGVEMISTGGTAKALRSFGHEVKDVSALTGFPEMLDGRVKTLHPAIHGPILARRDLSDHQDALAHHGFGPIDLVVVNLYPFEATVASGASFEDCVEQIDIGGPALIRAGAKNWAGVAVVTSPDDYTSVIDAVKAGSASAALRKRLAAKAFARTSAYDGAIAAYFAKSVAVDSGAKQERWPARTSFAAEKRLELRYGENPHQSAAFYVTGDDRPGVATAETLQGKALSYNNLNDTDAAFELVADLNRFDQPACAIIKHANPCGAAIGENLTEAYLRAKACDPVSAFGGIVALNRPLDAEAAAEILKVFTEVVIAPAVDAEAAAMFAAKPNVRLLATGALPDPKAPGRTWRSVAGGFLAQDRDAGIITAPDLRVVTKRAPTPREIDDLLFAWTVAKHVKSNAIVYAVDGATVGVGAGQMSRLDSSRIAARKAEDMATEAGLAKSPADGAVVASDAFFPFADGLMAAAAAGVTAAIQPGGSMRDQEVIEAADSAGISMVFTGMRHFRH